MFCPNCGGELPENAAFCKECGIRIETPRMQTPGAQWQTSVAGQQTSGAQRQAPTAQTPGAQWQTSAAQAPSAAIPSGAAKKDAPAKRTRTILIVAVAAVALLAGGIGGFMLWSNQRQAHDESAAVSAAYDASHARHAVVFKVDAAGYSDGTASKIPVHVTGSDADGAAVDEDAFVDAEGRGVELAQGVYAVSVVASPLTSDGTVYDVPSTSWDVSIGGDVAAGDPVDAAAQPMTLTPVADYAAVSDETLAVMYEYAGRSGMDQATADSYRDVTAAKRQAAIDEKAAAEARRVADEKAAAEAEAAAKCHFSCDAFELDLPASWADEWSVHDGYEYRKSMDLENHSYVFSRNGTNAFTVNIKAFDMGEDGETIGSISNFAVKFKTSDISSEDASFIKSSISIKNDSNYTGK